MVFHCRCFSISKEEKVEEEIEYETATQVPSTSTQTFYNVLSKFNPFVTNSQTKTSSLSNNLKEFTFSELKAATNNVSPSSKIGEGGFGCVYTGIIKNPRDSSKRLNVAVKQLRRIGLHGHKAWVKEVTAVGVVEHPNLVKLVGYCAEDDEREIRRLLVYEYMSNKSVEDHLSTKSGPRESKWLKTPLVGWHIYMKKWCLRLFSDISNLPAFFWTVNGMPSFRILDWIEYVRKDSPMRS